MHNGEKVGIMYVWAFKMQDVIITGRTWDEFNILLELLSDFLDLGPKLKLVIYVHNLAYEFQFMRKHIEWAENGLSENGFRGIKNDVFSHPNLLILPPSGSPHPAIGTGYRLPDLRSPARGRGYA